MSEIIQNEQRFTYQGFNVEYSEPGLGTALSSLKIMPGNIIFDRRNPEIPDSVWKNGNEYHLKESVVVSFPNNDTNYGRLDAVFLLPDYTKKYFTNVYSINIKVATQISQEDIPLPNIIPYGAFIGLVYIPALYPSSNQKLYFRKVNEIFTESNFSKNVITWVEGITEKTEIWKTNTLYLKNQIIRYEQSLWLCIKTHPSSNFTNDVATGLYWVPLTAEGVGDSCCDELFFDQLETLYDRLYKVTYIRVKQDDGTFKNCAISSRKN